MSKIDDLLLGKCKNNKQRKLSNIRVKNSLRMNYQSMKNEGLINDFCVKKVVIRKRIQSVLVCITPLVALKEVTINFKTD